MTWEILQRIQLNLNTTSCVVCYQEKTDNVHEEPPVATTGQDYASNVIDDAFINSVKQLDMGCNKLDLIIDSVDIERIVDKVCSGPPNRKWKLKFLKKL